MTLPSDKEWSHTRVDVLPRNDSHRSGEEVRCGSDIDM